MSVAAKIGKLFGVQVGERSLDEQLADAAAARAAAEKALASADPHLVNIAACRAVLARRREELIAADAPAEDLRALDAEEERHVGLEAEQAAKVASLKAARELHDRIASELGERNEFAELDALGAALALEPDGIIALVRSLKVRLAMAFLNAERLRRAEQRLMGRRAFIVSGDAILTRLRGLEREISDLEIAEGYRRIGVPGISVIPVLRAEDLPATSAEGVQHQAQAVPEAAQTGGVVPLGRQKQADNPIADLS